MNDQKDLSLEDFLDEIHDIIQNITDHISEKKFSNLYRGESRIFDKVCSGLYRDYLSINEITDFAEIHEHIVKTYNAYLRPKENEAEERNEMDILAELQHYGAKTNLIDFTPDFLIALFFACEIDHEQNGRIIILKNVEIGEYEIVKPHKVVGRIIHQKSRFVHSSKGFLDQGTYKQIHIPNYLKEVIISYLEEYHDITREYIYNDVLGFITLPEIQSYYNLFKKGEDQLKRLSTMGGKQNYSAAIKYLEGAKSLNPSDFRTLQTLIQAYSHAEKYDEVIKCCEEAIKLNYPPAEFMYHKAEALYLNEDYEAAQKSYEQAIRRDRSNVLYYLGRCKSLIKFVLTKDEMSEEDSEIIIADLKALNDVSPNPKEHLKRVEDFLKAESITLPDKISNALANLLGNANSIN